MSNQNNNRRYTVFSQQAPQNKNDLWLSYNLHQGDNNSETVDNPTQRNCDLILKAWDCGQWIPVVGFNSTAANKMDIVDDVTANNIAVFTSQSPCQLTDMHLGDLLHNTNFVSGTDWSNVFGSSSYNWSSILGDTVWSIINSGGSGNTLPLAETNTRGAIKSNAISLFNSNIYSKTSLYSSDECLYVDASDILDKINNIISASGSQYYFDIQKATTTRFGGIKADTYNPTTPNAFKPVEVKFGINSDRLCVDGHDIIDAINQIGSSGNASVVNVHYGLDIERLNNEPYIGIEGVGSDGNIGKFSRVDNSANGIEWVTIDASSDIGSNQGKNTKLARITIGGKDVDIYGLADTSNVQNGGVVIYDEINQKLVCNDGTQDIDISSRINYDMTSYVDEKILEIADASGITIDLSSYALASGVVTDIKTVTGRTDQFKVTKNGADTTFTINNVASAQTAVSAVKDGANNNISTTYAKNSDLAAVATSGNYSDLNNKPDLSIYAVSSTLATVAITGSYDDLSDKPTIPTKMSDLVNDIECVTSKYSEQPATGNNVTIDTTASTNKKYTVQGSGTEVVTLEYDNSTASTKTVVVIDNSSRDTGSQLVIPDSYKIAATYTTSNMVASAQQSKKVFNLLSGSTYFITVENEVVWIDRVL